MPTFDYDKISCLMKNISTSKTKVTKVFVALSGGVDSAVSAMLLVKEGYDVTGVFMKNWSGEEFGLQDDCPWKQDQDDAQSICKMLDIPFRTYNFEKEYREEVIDYFFSEYKKGNTPNPDIMCNQQIKFGRFLDKAMDEGADLIATGHYARKAILPGGSDGTDRPCESNGLGNSGGVGGPGGKNVLLRAKDQSKDQTYFLYRITEPQLAKTLFPIGDLTKKEVRKIAQENNIPVSEKKDSQGICFIGKIDTKEFLQMKIKPRKGNIKDIDTGKKVGEHDGVWYYTLGQREGLRIGGADKPYFVAGKDVRQNIIFAAKGKDNPALYVESLELKDLHWINGKPQARSKLKGMVRYRQKPQDCSFAKDKVQFTKPVWIPSPGQSAVLIDGEVVLGGGIIKNWL